MRQVCYLCAFFFFLLHVSAGTASKRVCSEALLIEVAPVGLLSMVIIILLKLAVYVTVAPFGKACDLILRSYPSSLVRLPSEMKIMTSNLANMFI